MYSNRIKSREKGSNVKFRYVITPNGDFGGNEYRIHPPVVRKFKELQNKMGEYKYTEACIAINSSRPLAVWSKRYKMSQDDTFNAVIGITQRLPSELSKPYMHNNKMVDGYYLSTAHVEDSINFVWAYWDKIVELEIKYGSGNKEFLNELTKLWKEHTWNDADTKRVLLAEKKRHLTIINRISEMLAIRKKK